MDMKGARLHRFEIRVTYCVTVNKWDDLLELQSLPW